MSLAIFKTIVQKGKTFHGGINKQEGWGQVLSYFNDVKLNNRLNTNFKKVWILRRKRLKNGIAIYGSGLDFFLVFQRIYFKGRCS